jgi:pimeloyl-ACP methyl ester carboxylesterase
VSISTLPAGPALHLWTWQGGQGPPLVYLHGYDQHPGSAPFLEHLAQRRAVLAPEHPGYGTSTSIESVEDILDVVLAHRSLIEDWGRGPVDLVGHSLGGMFAAELAVFCPGLVRRLVLVDAFGLWDDAHPGLDPFASNDPLLKAARWHAPERAPETEPSNFVPDAADPHGRTLFRARNLAAATKFMWPFPDRGLRRRLAFIGAPTLVLHGESDGLVPMAHAETLAGLIPNARLQVIPEAGHLPMLEQEAEFLSAVEKFLDEA